MSLETMTKLATTTVGAGGISSVTFSNISQNYTDLIIRISARDDRTANPGSWLYYSFNGSSVGQTNVALLGQGSSSAISTGASGNIIGLSNSATSTSSSFSNCEIRISNYSSNSTKSFSSDSVFENNATRADQYLISGLWSNPSPITSITFSPDAGQIFLQNSTFTIYGVKNAAKTAGNSIKATGGNIVFDGTYVYHVFNSSGIFAPSTSLRADYLVVAGGGCATNSRGGGGGAGGLRSTVGNTGGGGSLEAPLSLSAIPYTVTVGAGGAYNAGAPVNGNDSGFATIISTGGGGGGGAGAGTPASGGSGGGAGTNSLTPGSGTTNQGYAGGAGSANYYGGGGGGGAGAVGQSIPVGSTNNGGAGGAGVLVAALATATGAGVSGYFAGGGGGGYFSASAGSGSAGTVGGLGGAGGGGNAAQGAGQTGTAGTPNTGGGGGSGIGNPGGTGDTAGASGGSGIVIIRYKG